MSQKYGADFIYQAKNNTENLVKEVFIEKLVKNKALITIQ